MAATIHLQPVKAEGQDRLEIGLEPRSIAQVSPVPQHGDLRPTNPRNPDLGGKLGRRVTGLHVVVIGVRDQADALAFASARIPGRDWLPPEKSLRICRSHDSTRSP